MAMALRSILLRITGDPSDAKRALAETAAELKRVGAIKAEPSVVLKRGAELRKEIDTVKARLAALAQERVTPEVELQARGARADLARLERELGEVDGRTVEAKASLRSEAVKAQIAVLQAQLDRLSQQEATPRVKIAMARALEQIDRLEAKLSRLDHKDVDVNVHVKVGGAALAGLVTGLSSLAAGIVTLTTSSLAAVPAIGSMLAALTVSAPVTAAVLAVVLGLAAALGTVVGSFAAAAAGAVALGVALAGAFGPVALVGILAMAKLVSILKAVKAQSADAATAAGQQAGFAASLASAQDGVRSATDSLAQAQSNLEQQTTAAYRAWHDSIETVKDDLLGVQHAQLGIEDANLRLREAQLALKEFQASAGSAGDAVGAIFDKFTDVSVDTSGLRAALAATQGASGDGLGEADQLKLERLILNVREAKLGEKDATDKLHDANVTLARDRSVAADFAERGIAAFAGYRAAVQGVTAANRALIASNRQVAQAKAAPKLAAASVAATDPAAGLSDTEKRFGEVLARFKKLFAVAFGPALDAVFGGAIRGMDEFSKALEDRRIKDALTGIGEAIGEMFVTLGKLFASKEFRDGFVELAKGGAELVRVLGSEVFPDFARLLLRIAVAALPDLLTLFQRLADKLHLFVASTRDGEKFRKKIRDLIDETALWARRIGWVIQALIDLVQWLRSAGRWGVKAFKDVSASVSKFASDLKSDVGEAVAWVRNAFNNFVGFFKRIGTKIGDAFSKGFSVGIHGIEKLAKGALNLVIGVLNKAIHGINKITSAGGIGDAISKAFGGGSLHIDDIPKLAAGGVATRSVFAQLGEAGKEAILPLTHNVLRQLGLAISAATPTLGGGAGLQPAFAGAAGGDRYGYRVDNMHVNVKAPAGELPDAQTTATALARLLESKAGGSPRD